MLDFENAGLKIDFIVPSEACATEDAVIKMTISNFHIEI